MSLNNSLNLLERMQYCSCSLDEGSHIYNYINIDGSKQTTKLSVTKILSPSNYVNEAMSAAASFGTDVHRQISHYADNRCFLDGGGEKEYMTAVHLIEKCHQAGVTLTNGSGLSSVFSYDCQVIGCTPDLLGTAERNLIKESVLVEVKTGCQRKHHHAQVAIYAWVRGYSKALLVYPDQFIWFDEIEIAKGVQEFCRKANLFFNPPADIVVGVPERFIELLRRREAIKEELKILDEVYQEELENLEKQGKISEGRNHLSPDFFITRSSYTKSDIDKDALIEKYPDIYREIKTEKVITTTRVGRL